MLEQITVGFMVMLRNLVSSIPHAGLWLVAIIVGVCFALALRCPGCCEDDPVFSKKAV